MVLMRLCREWACPPSVVREQRATDVLDLLAILAAEAKVQAIKRGK